MRNDRAKAKNVFIITAVIAVALAAIIFVYFGNYYHSSDKALNALKGNNNVFVSAIDDGYLFDGPGTADALVFYPGAKVEASAYAPLMLMLSEGGVDCFLCKMPLNFPLLDKDKARDLRSEYDYDNWYLSGHSLGGVTASMLASENREDWAGIILLASFPTEVLDEQALSIYGSEDKVLNHEKYTESINKGLWQAARTEAVIEGGNHAQFGDYGIQKGDGQATISSDEQQEQTAVLIIDFVYSESQRQAA